MLARDAGLRNFAENNERKWFTVALKVDQSNDLNTKTMTSNGHVNKIMVYNNGRDLYKLELWNLSSADEKLSNVSLKIDYYDTMLVYLESILKVIQNRTYQIKNAIEFMRFQSGLGWQGLINTYRFMHLCDW